MVLGLNIVEYSARICALPFTRVACACPINSSARDRSLDIRKRKQPQANIKVAKMQKLKFELAFGKPIRRTEEPIEEELCRFGCPGG